MFFAHQPPAARSEFAVRLRARIGRMPVVGRTAELAAIRAAIAATVRGEPPAAIMLVGEAGIGKSRLLEHACAEMTAAGGALLNARCVDERGMPPYALWIDALADRTPATSDLATLRELLAGAAAGDPSLDRLTPEQRKLRLFATVTSALERLARQRPLLVAIDDLHWSDAASNELLRHVLIHAGAVPLLVLGTYRWEDAMANPALTRTTEELHRRRLLTTIPVGPLAAADTDHQLTALLGREDHALAQAIHGHCEGNPFFVEEVVRALADAGLLEAEDEAAGQPIAADQLPVPRSVAAVIERRLDRATAPCRATLEVAALAGNGIMIDLLASIGQTTAAQIAAHLDEGTALALIRPVAGQANGAELTDGGPDFVFRHDRVREVIAAGLNPVRRRELHRRLGEVLEETGGDAGDMRWLAALTHHFRLARETERAAIYAERLGDAAMQAHAHADAARAYQMAVMLGSSRTSPDSGASAASTLLLKAGDAALAAGDTEGAIAAYTAAEQGATAARVARDRAGALRRLGAAYARREAFDLAVTYLEAAGAALAADMATSDRSEVARDTELAEILIELSTIQGTSLAAYDAAIANGRRGLELMTGVPHPGGEAQARLALAKALSRAGSLAEGQACLSPALPLAVRAGDHGLAAEIAGALANHAYWIGDLAASTRLAHQRRQFGEQAGDPYVLRHATPWLANLAIARGNWAEAETLLAAATPHVDRIESPEPDAFLCQLRGLLRLTQGRYEEAIAHLEEAVAGFRRSGPATVVWYLGCLAHAYLLAGERAAMARTIDETSRLIDVLPPAALPRAPALTHLGLIAVRCNDVAAAGRYADALRPFAGQLHWVLVDRVLGMLATTLGDLPTAERHFAAASTIATRGGIVPELALTLVERGLALRRASSPKSRSAGDRLVTEAVNRLRRLGMIGEVARITTPPKPAPSSARALPAGLTAREAEVLTLVCDGLTNREIGDRLAISEKTVTNHLTHIFTKAGVENRSAAVAFALRHGLA